MNIIFLGPQSSGKGTQAALLSKELNIPTMTLGNILRKKQKEANDEGKMIASLLSQGELLPDELVDEIVREELRSERYGSGVILDGYPRNSHQAEELEKYLRVDRVIFLDVPDGIVMQRMLARRVCDGCGENYSLISKPPKKENVCDECGGILVSRQDDTKEAIAKRLNIYHEKTKPLIDYYQGIGKLIYIDGTGGIEAVRGAITRELQIMN
jgi:adenylate kinase